ncbi:MAG TPA: ATP-binding protein [Feifaniaceae bacterium]|nr:ATP-binding protein [Feifaniaceae bacterium]
MKDLSALYCKLRSLVLFRGLLTDEVFLLLMDVLTSAQKTEAERVDAYAAFAARLFETTEDWTGYVWGRAAASENPYVHKRAVRAPISETLNACLSAELFVLEELSRLDARSVRQSLDCGGYLPEWTTHPFEFAPAYEARMAQLNKVGYGVYAEHAMFHMEDGDVVPVQTPDPVRLNELKGYERERALVRANTLALINGKPAANTLLYGDAGTGKSSTVKALVNEFCGEGLRLIEIKKHQLLSIPSILERLRDNPLRFLLYLDDLSFAECSEESGALKAILEGSAAARTKNVAIYATSNRRHIVNERFSDREGGDIHRNETIEEQTSLSERFGLTVYFGKPDKDAYLSIVSELLEQRGLEATDELLLRAERHALSRGGRSPRAAKQFVEALGAGEGR